MREKDKRDRRRGRGRRRKESRGRGRRREEGCIEEKAVFDKILSPTEDALFHKIVL